MPQQEYILKIDRPCGEEWVSMSENNLGRYCAQCSKAVVDFTKLTDDEMIRILEKSSGQLCGRLSGQQTNRIIRTKRYKSHPKIHKILAGILLLGGLLENSNGFSRPVAGIEIASPAKKEPKTVQRSPEEIVKDSTGNIVSGTVSDSAKEPIPGVSIQIKGLPFGTISDADGRFKITIPDSLLSRQIILQVQSVGFRTVEQIIEKRDFPLNITCILTQDDSVNLGILIITKVQKKKWWQFWK